MTCQIVRKGLAVGKRGLIYLPFSFSTYLAVGGRSLHSHSLDCFHEASLP